MLKCSKEAFAACPDRKGCGCPEAAVFAEGSECDMFNRHIAQDTNVLTNADRIRAMSDEELAAWMAECNAYGERADASQWLPWLQEPVEDQS